MYYHAGTAPQQPRSVQLTSIQNNTKSSTVTLQWDAPPGTAVDNYSVTVDPPFLSGPAIPGARLRRTLTLILQYNINYIINITGVNCIGRGSSVTNQLSLGNTIAYSWAPLYSYYWTLQCFYTVNCSAPSAASGVIIEPYCNTTEGAVIYYQCDGSKGLIPRERITSLCERDSEWTPDPGLHNCSGPTRSKYIILKVDLAVNQ